MDLGWTWLKLDLALPLRALYGSGATEVDFSSAEPLPDRVGIPKREKIIGASDCERFTPAAV